MEMRTVRKAALLGGLATGALLFTGTAAQAEQADVDQVGADAVLSTPEQLGGLPVPSNPVSGLNAVVPTQGLPVPGLDNAVDGQADQAAGQAAPDAGVDELVGGLPVRLPF